MTGEPTFALCEAAGTLIADGVKAHYRDVAAAQAALRSGSIPIVVGALPFDVDASAALLAPQSVGRSDGLPGWPPGPLPGIRIAAALPTPADHGQRIRCALDRLRAPDSGLRKVVLARALRLIADAPLDARVVLSRLVNADRSGYGYLVDLTAAGEAYTGAMLVGASPELLVDRDGETVTCRPLAGTAPRSADPETDRTNGAKLAASEKNRYEHRLVIETMREVLDPLCTDLRAPSPQLSSTATLWHLSTPITGRLREPSTTAMDLALALHPTPAVCGVPTGTAAELISTLEGERGFYAGTVGYCDGRGDGRWVVGIRCAQLSADRRTVLAHSGGGIVAESDPDDEVAETTTKFTTILSALGVSE